MDLDQVSPFGLWLSSVIYSNPWEQKYYSCTFQRTIPSHPTCLGRLGVSYDNNLATGKAMESQQLFLVALSRVGSDTDKFQERMLEPRSPVIYNIKIVDNAVNCFASSYKNSIRL
ncbi:predicted protein [Histoplasma capsulatum var. duboisii H88]|uniref:Predicted protein n=2 Tax=Ajellomyces capsulatus TaxID=5037 RepID=F0U5W9_AJEC8|nr:predicted protein [Histoplasma capsulatum H143]EGC42204.1 predicted protein [Histoplasma capsulatum var. duboisii H88]